MNATDTFIDSLFSLMENPIPERVVCQAKECVLDYLGVTLAGATMIKEKGNSLLDSFGDEQGNVTVIGFQRKESLQNAVLVNGLSSHVAELDDGNRYGMIHLGSPIISALLPLAEHEEIEGKDFLTGIIIGYEAAVRLSSAIQPSHKQRGYHTTGTCGTIGAAMAAAAALGFTRAQMKETLSAAATCSSGILEVDNSDLKAFNAGRAALDGLVASFVARAGFTGPDDVLGGRRGFLPIMSDQFDLSSLEREPENIYAIEEVYRKPYSACRHAHPAIDAAINMRSKYNIPTDNIKRIMVHTYKSAIEGHDHTVVRDAVSAKMSIPYSVAVSLEYGRAGIEEFSTELLDDKKIASLTRKVGIYADDDLSSLVSSKRAAIVELITYDNKCFTERIEMARGEPENPLSDDEMKEKFIYLATYGNKSREACQEIVHIVSNLEHQLHNLFRLL